MKIIISKRVIDSSLVGCIAAFLTTTPLSALAQGSGNILEYTGPAWSPYIAGGLIGVLVILTMYFSNHPLGASSAYAHLIGLFAKIFIPGRVRHLHFYRNKEPVINWGVMLLLGVVAGAYLAAWNGGEVTGQWLPVFWRENFGEQSLWLRAGVAFAGGVLMALGARVAGGCTSGHGISGALQLSVGSWIALLCFFLGGVPTAMLLFGRF